MSPGSRRPRGLQRACLIRRRLRLSAHGYGNGHSAQPPEIRQCPGRGVASRAERASTPPSDSRAEKTAICCRGWYNAAHASFGATGSRARNRWSRPACPHTSTAPPLSEVGIFASTARRPLWHHVHGKTRDSSCAPRASAGRGRADARGGRWPPPRRRWLTTLSAVWASCPYFGVGGTASMRDTE